MRVNFFLKKQNLAMEGVQEKTVCVEGKFRVTSFKADLKQRLKATSCKIHKSRLLTYDHRKCGGYISVRLWESLRQM